MLPTLRENGFFAVDGFRTWHDAVRVMTELRGRFFGIKVHTREYWRVSPEKIVNDIHELGYRAWPDDKLIDIPTVVAREVRGLAECGADIVSVYYDNNAATIAAAVAAYRDVRNADTVRDIPGLGVAVISVLTSTGKLAGDKKIQERVIEVARIASSAGAFGVVCSPAEVKEARVLVPSIKYLTPGIRLPGSPRNDQERVGTPAHALRDGSNFLVIGRDVTDVEDRIAATENIEEDLASAAV